MSTRNWIKHFWRDRSGSNAVEFAFLLPAFILCIVAAMYAAMGMYVADSVQFAVEAGARCAALDATTCGSSSTAITYTQGVYKGPASPTPTFAYAVAACGKRLTGTVTYSFGFGMSSLSVPISATSCHP
jgi:Flp pilus assembly protein TadG